MRFYCEITLLPNPEASLNFLWSKAFQQIHLGLVEMQDEQRQIPIGVSFPEYTIGKKYSALGSKLRLFAQDESTLRRFDRVRWLDHLSDYVHCTSIRSIPEKLTGYALYQREQPKTSKERLARRYASRHSMDYETVLNGSVELSVKSESKVGSEKRLMRYSEMPHKIVTTPFIRLKSLSSNKTFCLWIKKTMALNLEGNTYSSYGLSATSTVPEF